MLSSGARNFAKFATRATPKHAMRAMGVSAAKTPSVRIVLGSAGPGAFSMRSVSTILSSMPMNTSHRASPVAAVTAAPSAVSEASSSTDRSMSTSAGVEGPSGELSAGSTVDAADDLDAILRRSRIPVIVDFYAEWVFRLAGMRAWCGPCRMLAPILESAVKEHGKAVLVKVNVDEAEETAFKYKISSLPTVAAFKDGKMVGHFLGSRDKAFIKTFLDTHI
ncbi:hypothetical protein HK105_205161 [Polyrhizophydium stewartii]|uniref:Thioredoxin domain-containing protein n=1 Tax=Polyrhizophydium stewartii TaxID=2732419 RepID=A0ABR4N6X1_9FUNG|nr:hypothetical protein HK105_002459 [Polyrhizophydium stewartii]